ncbi:hypothetical protein FLBR109950_10740 [Flavobacterium branchiophilum]|uniref:Uncharacterized protein n=2 Tax=Flavobacterium branchiophilum TaxID=55197 RepID=G2Z0S5_FLABF|nr:hypothetical protein [Flavobacterium branchiophilum]TQM41905.1 hypothetical protein BC670_2919 [Flavobacterium branchiophilum]GEM55401.1 hypothetical protein FB1_16220 [Flavobacterium branchiophilum NBRC 15030 = ATCC 35035]CCB69470.1 Hypothetical protein FBFL15_1400 [Flavobacterium branchiophilum FL-15]
MKDINELKNRKTPIVVLDKSLNKFDNLNLFKDKLEKANKTFERIGLPKQWAK